MNVKNFSLATIGGAIVFFLLGYLFYAVILADFFSEHMMSGVEKSSPVIWLIFLGDVFLAALVTLIFGRWASISTFATGAKAGAIIAGLIALTNQFIMLGSTNLTNFTAVFADFVVWVVMGAIAGGVIAAILGKVDK